MISAPDTSITLILWQLRTNLLSKDLRYENMALLHREEPPNAASAKLLTMENLNFIPTMQYLRIWRRNSTFNDF